MNIQNKTAFITGGTTGIGLAIAMAILKGGGNVAVYSKSSPPPQTKKDFLTHPNVLVIKGDVRNQKEVTKALKKTVATFGSVDILINNAAIAKRELFVESSAKDWEMIIDTNIKGALITTKEALAYMIKQRSGIIINISSGAGLYGIGGLALYSLSKAALVNFTQSLDQEVKQFGVRVITVAPGSTDTRMFLNLFPDDKAKHTPEDVAGVVLKAITGEISPNDDLVVDVFEHTR